MSLYDRSNVPTNELKLWSLRKLTSRSWRSLIIQRWSIVRLFKEMLDLRTKYTGFLYTMTWCLPSTTGFSAEVEPVHLVFQQKAATVWATLACKGIPYSLSIKSSISRLFNRSKSVHGEGLGDDRPILRSKCLCIETEKWVWALKFPTFQGRTCRLTSNN